MKPIELFALFGSGYVCGLSVGSGFVLQGLRKLFASRWNNYREALWIAACAFNAVLCGLITVILVGLVVVADQPGRADFWLRMALYALGVGGGTAFVFLSVRLINIGLLLRQEAARSCVPTPASGR